jgi:hypothetical protein
MQRYGKMGHVGLASKAKVYLVKYYVSKSKLKNDHQKRSYNYIIETYILTSSKLMKS